MPCVSYSQPQSPPWLGECTPGRAVLCFAYIFPVDLISHRFLYQLYVAIDANFKLKAKNRGAKAVVLSDGYGYVVQDADYACHLSKNTDDMKEVSSVLPYFRCRV
jgi:hypothetical protein